MFIDGTLDPDPSALPRVAEAVAARYGLAPDDMARRMSAGRFRVKSGADRATADALMRDLEAVGAACLIVDESGNVVVGRAEPAVITDRKPPRAEVANPAVPGGRAYSSPHVGAASGQPSAPGPYGANDRAATEVTTHAHPGPAALHGPNAGAALRGRGGVALAETPLDRARGKLADTPRLRFAVGVFAALILGFLPALLFAEIRGGALADVDDEVRAEQAQVHDLDAWNRLDDMRSSMMERKRSLRSNIAIGGLVIWAVFGAGLAFFWFRRIDWEFYRSSATTGAAPGPTPGVLADSYAATPWTS